MKKEKYIKGTGPVSGLSSEQWEVNLKLTPEGSSFEPATCFNPIRGKNRVCTHERTNECDH